jgi:hypothetical protein
MSDNTQYVLSIFLGIFLILAGVMAWPWFMDQYLARFLIELIGHRGTRISYVVVGGFAVVTGIGALLFG